MADDFDEMRKKRRKRRRPSGEGGVRYKRSALAPYKQPATLRGTGAGRKAPDFYDPPDDQALETPDGVVWVEGRAVVPGYDAEKRAAVAALERAAKILGLTVHDVPAASVAANSIRRRWATVAVDLDEAVAEIRDKPGITVLDWTKNLYMQGVEMNDVNFAAAKARAANAMSKLIRAGRIVKVKSVDGTKTLWIPSMAPH